MEDTLESSILRAKNKRKLMYLDLLPRYFDGPIKLYKDITKRQMKKVPFSSYFNTYEEFNTALFSTLDMWVKNIEISDDLFNRLYKTQQELGIVVELD